jgi:hypothetical protein
VKATQEEPVLDIELLRSDKLKLNCLWNVRSMVANTGGTVRVKDGPGGLSSAVDNGGFLAEEFFE